MTSTIAHIAVLIFLIAVLYSSVGHAGASGYLAVMWGSAACRRR